MEIKAEKNAYKNLYWFTSTRGYVQALKQPA